ncbi:MAG TPA: hypothetical protein VM369_09865 [Candidatus Binatia bacterium]|nr:hypothetical protein [Candidatus Binatia bacterium]
MNADSTRTAQLPGAEQQQEFDRWPAGRAVELLLQFRGAPPGEPTVQALAAMAGEHGGTLRWAGAGEQVLVGPVQRYDTVALLHFPTRTAALGFVRHAGLAAGFEALQVSVLSPQPRMVRVISALAAFLAPRLPLDDTPDNSPEPGLGTSIMPSAAGLAEFHAHPRQDRPVVMLNWLKYRAQASYQPPRAPCSGATAYLRYGRVALLAVHALGGKVLYLGRFQQHLVGAGGEPQAGRWDECVLVQYPSRATFHRMTALRRYRRALDHRTAGLAEHGQGLVVTQPEPRFIWAR